MVSEKSLEKQCMEQAEGFRVYRLWCSFVNCFYIIFIGIALIWPLLLWSNGQTINSAELLGVIKVSLVGCFVTFIIWLILFGLNMLFPKKLVAVVTREGLWTNNRFYLFKDIKEVRYHTDFPTRWHIGHCSLLINLMNGESVKINYAPRVLQYYLLRKCHAKWRPDKRFWLYVGIIAIPFLVIFLVMKLN